MISISIATAMAGLGLSGIIGLAIGVIVGALLRGSVVGERDERIAALEDYRKIDDKTIRTQGREIAEWRAKDQKRRADAKRAHAIGLARQAEIRAAKRDRETELRNERHAEMRQLVGDLV